MKKRISFILAICLLLPLMNTFAYENNNFHLKTLNFKEEMELRDNRYYYTIRYEN
ncbi:hypothetical protein [uncultured Peptoniphilus sp.]|uniref:hypothetical protein n=1 Tax=uncultured Peptoniphilus sp. TaxID=254354 RepID=UPI0028044192|nr:hypothetical protein [uncultured Peptoniphilus sp.]